jgi:tetratricopeptide (TPR) repeat protein
MIKLSENMLVNYPDDPGILNNLGLAWYEAGDTDKSVAILKKAISIKPDYANSHHNLGRALSKKGQTDEALKEFEEACRLGLKVSCDFLKNHDTQIGYTGFSEKIE